MPKIANIGVFAIVRPLTGNKTSPNYFMLVEEVLSFDLVGHMWKSVKNWLQEWVFNIYKWKWGRSRWIAYYENYLQKWFRDRYGKFQTAFPTEFPARFSRKISHKIFPQQFPTRFSNKNFPQDFPTRISCKIFPQTFPARISHKIFLQEFPVRCSRKHFPQDFPTRFSRRNFPTRISHKIFPQTFPTRISRKIFPKDFSTRISRKIFPSWILIGWLPITLFQMLTFHQSLPFLNCLFPLHPVPQDFPARISCKIFPQDFPELDPDCLAPHHPIPNPKFPPITDLLNRPSYHKSAKVSPPTFPQILWEPQINE